MKLNSFHRAAPVLALALLVGACNDGLTDINKDPNAPTEASAQSLLPDAQSAAIGRILGSNFDLTLTGLWVQYFAKVQYIDEDRYDLRPATIDAHWTGLYSGPLEDFHQIVLRGEEQNVPNWVAIGTVMQSWTFHVMTDVWGAIPYAEALQGSVPEGNVVSPKYDPQQEIYYDLLAKLTSSSEMIEAGAKSFGSEDLLYGGDMEKWRKFSNSLRMRLAMRMSEVDPTKAQAEFAAAYQSGGFTSNADNAQLVYASSPPSVNPFYSFFYLQGRLDHAISATIADTLKSLDDPRLEVYADPAPQPDPECGPYCGMPNGVSGSFDVALPTRARIGSYFLAPDAPAVLMSYSEVLFLEAEAAQRGWIAGDPAELYREAITASMEQYGIDQAAIGAYLAQPAVAYDPSSGLTQIALQKWIALYANGPEGYAEWRRTGVPDLTVVPASVNGNQIPVRVPYPPIEQSLNKTNLGAAVAASGGLTLNDPVWWDK